MSDIISQGVKADEDKRNSASPFINCNFILATAVIVERMWSKAGNLLSDSRRSMMPLIFETIIFLNINRDYWDDNLINRAIISVRTKKSKERASMNAPGLLCEKRQDCGGQDTVSSVQRKRSKKSSRSR